MSILNVWFCFEEEDRIHASLNSSTRRRQRGWCPLSPWDLSRLGNGERNLLRAKAPAGPSERARASHWAGGEGQRTATDTPLDNSYSKLCFPLILNPSPLGRRRSTSWNSGCGRWPRQADILQPPFPTFFLRTVLIAALLDSHRKLSFPEIVHKVEDIDPTRVFPQLHDIDGVLFLQAEPAGLTLTQELRQELLRNVGSGGRE